MPLQNYVPVV